MKFNFKFQLTVLGSCNCFEVSPVLVWLQNGITSVSPLANKIHNEVVHVQVYVGSYQSKSAVHELMN